MPALDSRNAPSNVSPQQDETAQGRLVARLLTAIDAAESTIDLLVRPMSPERRRAHPAAGGWSVDEILEHLCLANADYLGVMEGALMHASAPLGRGAWRASIGGWLLVRAMESERRSSSPAAIVPAAAPRAEVLDVMLESLARLRTLLARAQSQEWRRIRMSSPYARWLRLNFGDAALVVVRHTERHARQMARVAKSLEG